jgi:hypothetical protein
VPILDWDKKDFRDGLAMGAEASDAPVCVNDTAAKVIAT